MSAALHPDWSQILRKAWSMRFIALAMVFEVADVAMNYWVPEHAGRWFTFLAFFASAGAGVSRLIAQTNMTKPLE